MKIPVSTTPFRKVNQFSEPRTDVQSVLCFYHGKFPKITRPDKDVTLPHRLFPNAKLYIRCKVEDEQTRVYLHGLFKNLCEIELLPDTLDCSKIDAEVLFLQQDCWLFFGGVIERGCIENALILQKWSREAYIFYNDESLETLASLYEIMQLRKQSGKFYERNFAAYTKIKQLGDWSNIHVLANENKFGDWMLERVSDDLKQHGIQCTYLSDLLLYDLQKPVGECPEPKEQKGGVFIGSFHQTRARAWNKIFKTETLPLRVFGNGSDKLKCYPGSGEYLSNTMAMKLFQFHDWSIYMGKGTPSLYLGATFYEPLLNYCPIFIWQGTDPNKQLFPELDCYFSTEEELQSLVAKGQFQELWKQQLNHLFKNV